MNTYRLAPCPIYDIEGMQTWLEKMASKGLFLKNSGYFFNSFERKEPKKMRYRIEPLPKKNRFQNDAITMMEEFGWHFVTQHNYFVIYMTEDLSVPEPHSDSAIHASSFDYIIKNAIWNIMIGLFIFYRSFRNVIKYGFVTQLINIGPLFLIGMITLICYLLTTAITPIYHLTKYKQDIKNKKEIMNKKTNIFSRSYHVVCLSFFIVFTCLLLTYFKLDDVNKNREPISSYQEELPFETVKDIYPGKEITENSSNSPGKFNTVKIIQQGLLNTYINYHEVVDIKIDESKKPILFALYIEYYDLKIKQLASVFTKELCQQDFLRHDAHFIEDLNLPENVPYAYMNSKDFIFYVVEDHIVMKVGIFQEENADLEKMLSYQDMMNLYTKTKGR